jgi:hypothetical protein
VAAIMAWSMASSTGIHGLLVDQTVESLASGIQY